MQLFQRLEIAGELLVTHPAGVLYWAAQNLLVVADLHFEKGSSFARRGLFLPPYDTAVTLKRLAEVIEIFAPGKVVALGDSFHDAKAAERILDDDRETLNKLQSGRQWIWIAGNHDPGLPKGIAGDALPELSLAGLCFRHLPQPGHSYGEIAGHLHPMAKIAGRGGALRRRCFISNGARCVMPAFGALTGGLNVRDEAFASLFASGQTHLKNFVHVLGQGKVYSIAQHNCAPD
jgi:DNA ligase-associated metallophosphoesterase